MKVGYHNYFRLLWRTWFPGRDFPVRPRLSRVTAVTGLTVALLITQGIHRVALWLDEIFFPSYRDGEVDTPLFVLGVPRSGTTFLHRLLAKDEDRFTTLRLWEVLLAPAIIEKKVIFALAALDRKYLGHRIEKLIRRLDEKAFGSLKDVHRTSFFSAEEDYLALLPMAGCFLLMLPFPFEEIWRLARADEDLSDKERRRLMRFYKEIVQRHLHANGGGRIFLSKNCAFTPLAASLTETFPDCQIVGALRNPLKALPSQLSSVENGAACFGTNIHHPQLRDRVVTMLQYYYEHLMEVLRELPPERGYLLRFNDLTADPYGTVAKVYAQFGIPISPSYDRALQDEHSKARSYRSRHEYSLYRFGLCAETIREKFAFVFQECAFDSSYPASGPGLRVAIVSDAILGRNGVGTYFQDLVPHLAERLEQVVMLAPTMEDLEERKKWSLPVPGDATQRFFFPSPRQLEARLREIQPHVVILPTIGPYSTLGKRYARQLGAAVCAANCTDFGSVVEVYYRGYLKRFMRHVTQWYSGSMLRSADLVLAPSQRSADSAAAMRAREVRVVGTPVPPLFLTTPVEPLGREMKSCLYLGRLAPEKNLEFVLDAAVALPDIRFVIGGDGPLRSLIEKRASELPNVDYRGWLPREEVVNVLDESDLLLLPSKVESFGTVALEAFSRNRLVLVSAACGICDWPDIAENLFVIGEGESVAEAIQRVRDLSADERQQRAAAGRNAARRINDIAIDQWVTALRDLARSTGRLATSEPDQTSSTDREDKALPTRTAVNS